MRHAQNNLELHMQLLAAYAWASDGLMRGCSLVELLCTRQKIPYTPHIEENSPCCCSLPSFMKLNEALQRR